MLCRLALTSGLLFGLAPEVAAKVGEVVLEDTPSCDYFIVETSGGYSLMEWYGGVTSIWEGDKVFGNLESYGMETIQIEGRGEMRVWIEDYWAGRNTTLEYFYKNCD